MAFHDVRLPDDVEKGATGGPEFMTTIVGMSSGQEQRNIDWSEVKGSWDIAYGVQDKDDFDVCKGFFYARRGRAYGFRFKDWGDYEVEDEQIGLGDAAEDEFQLVKTYEVDGPLPYIRRITRPVADTLVVKLDGVVTTAFTLDALGVVNMNTAPGTGVVVTASFEFDVPVRFDTDKFNLELYHADAGAIGSLPICEIRE